MTYGLQVECREVESRVSNEEKSALRRHVRLSHPNLLGEGPDSTFGFTPLPTSGITTIPFMWLHAIHEASHLGLYRDHEIDNWSNPEPKEG